MRVLTIAALAAAGMTFAGAASAQTMEEAALCYSVANVTIPNVEESITQLKPPSVRPEAVSEMKATLELLKSLKTATNDYIHGQPQGWTEEDIAYLVMGTDIVIESRGPEAMRTYIQQCRSMFGL